MKTFLRDYGIIGVVIVVGMAAYVAYHFNREDILSYGLDVVGERLVEMVDSEDSRVAIRERFASFKQSVLESDVPPERVEALAANVLNMSSSGQTLSGEEADAVLDFAIEPSATLLPVPDHARAESGRELETPETEPPPTTRPDGKAGIAGRAPRSDRRSLEVLGDRLSTALELEARVKELVEMMPDKRPVIAGGIMFHSDGGLSVSVDTGLVAAIHVPDFARLTPSLNELERREMLVWRGDLANERQFSQSRAREDHDRVVEWRIQHDREMHAATGSVVDAFQVLKSLEMKGFELPVLSDSLEAALEAELQRIETERALSVQAGDSVGSVRRRVEVRVGSDLTP